MATETLIIEGTWEEILKHSDHLVGHRVRLTVLPPTFPPTEESNVRPENLGALEVLKELQETPLSEEDRKTLEDFTQFRKDHPLRFHLIEDAP